MKSKSLTINAVLNVVRQSITILFPFFTFPYVMRILGTEEFGRYQFAASVVTYFQLFAAFGIATFAIREGAPIRDDKKAVSNLASNLFSFNVVTCSLAYAVLALLVIFSPKINEYALLVFIQSMCMVLTLFGMEWVNNVYEDFLYITIRYIIIQLIALICIFLFVRSSEDTAIYCLIIVMGSYGGNIVNLFYTRRYISLPRLQRFPLKEYWRPLSILFVNSLATTIYVNADVTMIGLYFDDYQVGLYSFASKVYNILKYCINAAIIVTIPRLASVIKTDKEKYNKLIEQVLYALLLFLLPIAAGQFMLSKSIILIAGDEEYLGGYSSLVVLSFSLVFALLGSICTNCILIIHKLDKRVLKSTIISAIVNVLLNLIMIPIFGIVGAAVTTVIAEMVNMIIQYYYCVTEAHISFSLRIRDIISVIIGTIEVVGICFLVNKMWVNATFIDSLKIVGLSMILSGIAYFITLVIARNSIVYSFLQRVKNKHK